MLSHFIRPAAALAALSCLSACATAAPATERQAPPQNFSGVYFQNFEIQAFRADGQDQSWWVRAAPETWQALFADLPEGFQPPAEGFSIVAEVKGSLTEPGRYGHLGSFARGIYLTEIISAELTPIACALPEVVIFFGSGEASISELAAAQMDDLVARLRSGGCNIAAVHVFASADSVGAAAENQALSERRASAVRDALVSRGLDANLFAIEPHGEAQPWRPTPDNTSEPINRNARIVIDSPYAQ